jgi:hypothetical protein
MAEGRKGEGTMTGSGNPDKKQNLLLITLFITVTLFTAYREGYLPIITGIFWFFILGGFAISFWLAWGITTKRLLALILGIFIIEYIKESIGIMSGMWEYHGTNTFYNFGVWLWVLAGLTAYTLATRVVVKLIRKWNLPYGPQHNVAIIIIVFLLIPVTLFSYWKGAGGWFWLLYLSLLIAGLYTARRLDFPLLAAIVVTSWIVGNPSEFLGSAASGVWTFPHNPHYPPIFLLFGCWPLEILAQFALSAFLAQEPLDQYS